MSGTQGANSFDSATQPSSQPTQSPSQSTQPSQQSAQPIVSSTPTPTSESSGASTSTTSIISSANIAPPTPLNAPLPTDPLHPTKTVASGSGDLIVGETSNKKKPFAIIIIALIALAVIGMVALLIISSVSHNDTTSNTDSVNAFHRYANYLLFGEEKDEAPGGEFQLNTSYEIDRQLKSDTVDEQYWQKSQELLNVAISQYDNLKDPINPDMGIILSNYRKTFDFIYLYRQKEELNEEDLIRTYFYSGNAVAKTEVKEYYAEYAKISQIAESYAEQRVIEYDARIKLYEFYNSLGCIRNGVLSDDVCTDIPDETKIEEADNLSMIVIQASTRAEEILDQSLRGLKDGCWRIGMQLQEAPEDLSGESEEDIE